jgi:hypothetical protein
MFCVLLVTVYVVCYWLQYMLCVTGYSICCVLLVTVYVVCYWLSMEYWKGYERCVEKNWQEELRG